eukprot:scaffold7121_cov121-Isochrysis_galbana.AAC.6
MSMASLTGDCRTRSRISSLAGATATMSYARRASRAPVSANTWLSSSRLSVSLMHSWTGRVKDEVAASVAEEMPVITFGGLAGTEPVTSVVQHTTA